MRIAELSPPNLPFLSKNFSEKVLRTAEESDRMPLPPPPPPNPTVFLRANGRRVRFARARRFEVVGVKPLRFF